MFTVKLGRVHDISTGISVEFSLTRAGTPVLVVEAGEKQTCIRFDAQGEVKAILSEVACDGTVG